MIISNIIIKPVGAACNLDCSYCFYKNKKTKELMSDEILHSFINQYNKLKPLELKQNVKKCGRNDLCPCGSGKKFKKCHM